MSKLLLSEICQSSVIVIQDNQQQVSPSDVARLTSTQVVALQVDTERPQTDCKTVKVSDAVKCAIVTTGHDDHIGKINCQ